LLKTKTSQVLAKSHSGR